MSNKENIMNSFNPFNPLKISASAIQPPVYKWRVTIPKDGDFSIMYVGDINLWQRTWMRFIGWGVDKDVHKS